MPMYERTLPQDDSRVRRSPSMHAGVFFDSVAVRMQALSKTARGEKDQESEGTKGKVGMDRHPTLNAAWVKQCSSLS